MGLWKNIKRSVHLRTGDYSAAVSDWAPDSIRIPFRYFFFQYVRLPIEIRRTIRSSKDALTLSANIHTLMEMIDKETQTAYGQITEQYNDRIKESSDLLTELVSEIDRVDDEIKRFESELVILYENDAAYRGVSVMPRPQQSESDDPPLEPDYIETYVADGVVADDLDL